MVGSTMLLATGVMLLLIARTSTSAPGLGLVVFIGLVCVAAGCALHLSTMIAPLIRGRLVRAVVQAVVWMAAAFGVTWSVVQAPRPDLVLGLVILPPLVGLAGVARRTGSASFAWAFLALSLGLSALLAPIALDAVRATV